MKKTALIPVLLGSTRIPDKNLILVDGYPMAFRVAKACKESGVFDEVVLNSEPDEIESFAQMLGVRFYRRPKTRGGSACTMKNKSRRCDNDRCQTHDHFLTDFMETVDPGIVALVHTTSPLMKPETIRAFLEKMEKEDYDSMFTVEERYTETFLAGKPLNFSMAEKIPTQSLPPLQMISWALSAWKTTSFLESYRRDDKKENGPTFCGKMGLFPLDKVEALDADNWDDLYIIEACL
ncbi:MAG: N-acylneuraminate cytidylyltransferase, partial [Elusimicrobia bacterium]